MLIFLNVDNVVKYRSRSCVRSVGGRWICEMILGIVKLNEKKRVYEN